MLEKGGGNRLQRLSVGLDQGARPIVGGGNKDANLFVNLDRGGLGEILVPGD